MRLFVNVVNKHAHSTVGWKKDGPIGHNVIAVRSVPALRLKDDNVESMNRGKFWSSQEGLEVVRSKGVGVYVQVGRDLGRRNQTATALKSTIEMHNAETSFGASGYMGKSKENV